MGFLFIFFPFILLFFIPLFPVTFPFLFFLSTLFVDLFSCSSLYASLLSSFPSLPLHFLPLCVISPSLFLCFLSHFARSLALHFSPPLHPSSLFLVIPLLCFLSFPFAHSLALHFLSSSTFFSFLFLVSASFALRCLLPPLALCSLPPFLASHFSSSLIRPFSFTFLLWFFLPSLFPFSCLSLPTCRPV